MPEQPIIETNRLTIRLVERADLPSLLEVNGNDAVTRYLPYASWRNIEDGEAWLNRTLARLAAGEAWQFVIVHRALSRVIGSCLLFRVEASSSRAEVGYALAQEYWGAGYMLEAMQAFIGFAFGRLELRRLEANIDARNTASAQLLTRLGFTHEGLLRQRWVDKGEVSDSSIYGLLCTEWSPYAE